MSKAHEITCTNIGAPMSGDLAERLYRFLVEANLRRLGLEADVTIRKKTEAEMMAEKRTATA